MPSIPAGVGVWWPGNHSAIPTGWTRNTDFDTRYSKGTAAGVDPDVTGGNASHAHVSPSHLHSLTGHGHSGNSGQSASPYPVPGGGYIPRQHSHSFSVGTSTAADSSNHTVAWSTGDQQPSYFQCIYIESDGSGDRFPDDCIAYYNSATPPTDWTQHGASVSKFIVGAAGSSGNGGGTGGGAHSHADSSHTHNYSDHTHPHGGQTGNANQEYGPNFNPTQGVKHPTKWHGHTWAVNSSSGGQASGAATSATTANTTHEPEHVVMQAIQNTSGAGLWPEGIVAMWVGALSAIPDDWLLCDGNNSTRDLRGKQIKNSASSGSIGGTGGTAGHDHTDPTGHTHGATHSHSGVSSTTNDSNQNTPTNNAGGGGGSRPNHYHNAGISNTGGSLGSGVKTVDTLADTQPLFRTVAYLSSPEGPGGAATWFGVNF